MSRYLLLFLLALPFILASILSSLTQYKLGAITKHRFVIHTLFWLLIATGLAFAQNIYDFLYNTGLTQTDSLSLFDVIQIIAIIFLGYILNRARLKLEVIERRLVDLHQETSIRLSDKD